MKKHIVEALKMDAQRRPSHFFKYARRGVSIILCAVMILGLSSCWSRRELNTLAIVLGTAFDVGLQPDTLQVTAQVVKPGEIKSSSASSGGGSGQKAYANVGSTDKSAISALGNITHFNNRIMYFSHNRVLIFSRELAEQGILNQLDAFTRNYETRMNVYMLVSKGKASDILDEDFDLEEIPANHIAEMMENQRLNSETAIVTLRDFDIATLSASMAPVAPMIELYEQDGKKEARLEGTAVFKHGKMIGELNVPQTRGLIWVTGKPRQQVMTIKTQWGLVDLRILQANSSLKPVKNDDGSIQIRLELQARGCIDSNETTREMSPEDNIEMLQKLAQAYIRSDIENALEHARGLSADIFGFGEAIRRDYPKDWEKMKDNWDEMFGTLELAVEVEVKVDCTGRMGKPIAPGGAE